MRLFFRPGACSLSPNIVLREAGIPFTLDLVDRQTRKTSTGADFSTINPKGYVPTLELDDGQLLTEGTAIVQYLADSKPESHLAPPAGTMERYRLIEWLNYVATEMHKGFSPLFNSKASDEFKANIREALLAKYKWLNEQLADKNFLTGDRFTVADAYLFTILTWSRVANIDLATFPSLNGYFERIKARPAVAEALAAEKAATHHTAH